MDQLSQDLASLKIERAPAERQPRLLGKWLILAAVIAGGVLVFPAAKTYVEGLVFKREVDTTEVIVLSPIQSQVDLTATGYVVPQVTAKVGSKIEGRISKVFVHEGDAVESGQLLFELDPSDERSLLGSAQARVLAAAARAQASRAAVAQAAAELDRDQKLVELGATTPASVQDKELRIEALRKQLEATEAEVRVSRAEANVSGQHLRNFLIKAPINGTAVTKAAQVGDVVGPPMTLVELVDFESLLIEVDVPEARLAQIKPAGPCELVLDAAPNETRRCRVEDFAPRMNRAKATATVKVRLLETVPRLWPDMSAKVSFLAQEIDEALRKQPAKKLVARTALASDGGRPGLWIVSDQKLHFVPVSTGDVSGSNVELIEGPAPGTRAVLNPKQDFRAGQSVKDRRATSDT